MSEKQVAIYLDFENIAISAMEVYKQQAMPVRIEPLVSFAEAKGRLRVKKVYADWSKKKFAQYQKSLLIQGFELVHLPETNLSGKNGSDMRLVIDVMDHINTFPDIDTVIIGSGDSDFIPLLQYMQNKSKEVVVIGFNHSVSDVLKQFSSEFRSLEEILGPPAMPEGPTDRQRQRVAGIFKRFVVENGPGPHRLKDLKAGCEDIYSDFSPEHFGYSSFKKLLRDFRSDYISHVEKIGPKKVMVTMIDKRRTRRGNSNTHGQDRDRRRSDTARSNNANTQQERPRRQSESDRPSNGRADSGKQPLEDSPLFQKAVETANTWLQQPGQRSPMPLSRMKSGMMGIDADFDEKQLGFKSFKDFAHELVGKAFEKVEMDGTMWVAYFDTPASVETPAPVAKKPVKRKAEKEMPAEAPPKEKKASPEKRTRPTRSQNPPARVEREEKPRREARQAEKPRRETREEEKPRQERKSRTPEKVAAKAPAKAKPKAQKEKPVGKTSRNSNGKAQAQQTAASQASMLVEARKTLNEELRFQHDAIIRHKAMDALLEGYEEFPVMTIAQAKTEMMKRMGKEIDEETAIKFILTLKFGGALMPDSRQGSLSDKLLRLKEGINQSEALDYLYIEQVSDVLKRKHEGLTNSQVLELLFS